MALRSVWHGSITFLLVNIGVKLYTAIESAERISFNQLHAGKCLGPVGRKDQCKKCGIVVTKDDIAKGYKYDEDKWQVVTSEEIESITPESNKNIQILGFVDRTQIPDTFFDAPYLVAPDTPASSKTYALLKAVMERTQKVAIGKVILREREDPVVISATGDGLIIQTLRYAREVRTFSALPIQSTDDVSAEELALATTLVDRMITSFDQIDLTDHYYLALRDMLNKKIAGEEITQTATPAQPGKVIDIMAALRASLSLNQSDPIAAPEAPVPEADAPSIDRPSTQLTLVPPVEKKKRKRAA